MEGCFRSILDDCRRSFTYVLCLWRVEETTMVEAGSMVLEFMTLSEYWILLVYRTNGTFQGQKRKNGT